MRIFIELTFQVAIFILRRFQHRLIAAAKGASIELLKGAIRRSHDRSVCRGGIDKIIEALIGTKKIGGFRVRRSP